MRENFTPEELRGLQEALRAKAPPRCPRCGRVLDLTAIPPKPTVAYVRDRVVIQCGTCKLKGVADRS